MTAEPEGASCCVLIVDDDPSGRAYTRQLLSSDGHHRYGLIEAASGSAALAAILGSAAPRPDCVLLDDGLPDLDASGVLRALAERDALTCCPVIVLTSGEAWREGRGILASGAQDVLDRTSLTLETLSRAIENAIARFSLMRQLRERDATIRESDARLRLALEASNTGFWTWDIQSDIGTWSPEVYPIMGIEQGCFEVTGAAVFRMVHPHDWERVQAVLQGSMASGEGYSCEFRIVRPSGEVVWVENRGRTRYGSGGDPIGMIGTITDVSARKEIEQELRRREFELRTLAENTPDIYARFDREHRHVFVNAAAERATGRPRESFLGKSNRELGMPAELCDEWDAALGLVFATGRAHSITFAYECNDGTRHFAARLIPEVSSDGDVRHVLVVTHDVTERERHEQALRDAAQRKNEFLATLAHELRNPLAPIRTGLQLLKLAAGDSSARAKTLDAMERQLSHLVRLVDDLRDVSLISRGVVELRSEPVELRAIVDQAVELSQPLVLAGQHQLHLELPAEPLWVNGDLTRLAQAVSNLLNNSAKYTPSGGRIELAVWRDGGEAVIRVADSGIGIASEDLPKVFEMFAQLEASRDRAQGGLGIGLSLVRKLVTLHGGTVAAASPGKGQGSTFTLRLPAAAAEAGRPRTLAPAAGALRELSPPLRILIVDDNQDAAEMLADLLGLMGSTTRVAHDGSSALAAARAFAPELIFLDLGLPGMDGYEVASQLRSEGALDGVTLIALTGWGRSEDQSSTAQLGFDHHLTKPVEPGTILELVQRTASLRAARFSQAQSG